MKVEVQVPQQQQPAPPVASGGAPSAGVLIARTYAESVTSNPGDLELATASGATGFVRLLLLDLPSCNVGSYSTTPQLLAFANFGSSRLPTAVLAAAVHEYRVLLEAQADTAADSAAAPGTGPGQSRPASHHSSAGVTLATGLTKRSFHGLEAVAVKTFAEDVLWLTDGADGGDGLEEAFTNSMLLGIRSGEPSRIHGGQRQLKAMLQSKAVQAVVRGGCGGGKRSALWKTLASERLRKVQSHDPPVFTWEQPNAILAGAWGGVPYTNPCQKHVFSRCNIAPFWIRRLCRTAVLAARSTHLGPSVQVNAPPRPRLHRGVQTHCHTFSLRALEHPQVQQFLRGPEREMKYTRSGTFSDLRHARNFCNKYFGSCFSRSGHLSARATPQGRGRSAYVIITKYKDEHEKRVRAYEEDKAEAAVLLALLGSSKYISKCPGAAAGGSGAGGSRESPGSCSNAKSKSEVARVAASAGTGEVGERRCAKVEVIDLCGSP